eukprot:CAMPEP_0202474358 /NCGR_PEP_ID=MMETSP1360-20130828/92342_1 /ASSEMBLY_ACC=CAM_ASM_000848 /TAXON_ID=515479 /ORGANISM="Licmophora paradoxa, Strain CCMP2313" /LENGTH=252 /DNA_ID=CAMNT_0049101481 /DNA_START=410 /DNA_END=1165 /DNA_ORIENTATION=+
MEGITQLLNYCTSNPNATVQYHASEMVLHAKSDASYLSETKSRSRVAGFFYLITKPKNPTKAPAADNPSPPLNGAISIFSQRIKRGYKKYLDTPLLRRAIDSTMLPAIGTLSTQQSAPTAQTMEGITQLLNYCASNPNATIRYHASDMVLHAESDASYLSETKARSRAAGFFYLSTKPKNPTKAPAADNPSPPLNGAISIFSSILRKILSSTTEAELTALFHNGKEACPMRIALEEMGHRQPPTPIVTNNQT